MSVSDFPGPATEPIRCRCPRPSATSRSGGARSRVPTTRCPRSGRCSRPRRSQRAGRYGTDALRRRYVAGRAALRVDARAEARRRTGGGRRSGAASRGPAGARGHGHAGFQRDAHARRRADRAPRTPGLARRRRHRERRPHARARRARAEVPDRRASGAAIARARRRRAPARLPAPVDLQGSDEQGNRRRPLGAVRHHRDRSPRDASSVVEGADAYAPARWTLHPVHVADDLLATLALWAAIRNDAVREATCRTQSDLRKPLPGRRMDHDIVISR